MSKAPTESRKAAGRPKEDNPPSAFKTQRTLYVDRDLCRLVDEVGKYTATPFVKVVTGAILHFLFHGLDTVDAHDPHASPGPQPRWLYYAELLERREVPIEDLPLRLCEALVEDARRAKRMYERGDFTSTPERNVETATRELDLAEERLRGWKNNVKDFGKAGAITYMLEKLKLGR